MDSAVLTALNKRQADLLKEAKAADAVTRKLRADIDHIDGAIRTYDPAYRARKPQLTRAKRTDLSRSALDTLRRATGPMTLRDLTLATMARTGLDKRDGKEVYARMNRLRTILNRQQENAVVRQTLGAGLAALWEVVRQRVHTKDSAFRLPRGGKVWDIYPITMRLQQTKERDQKPCY